MWNWIYILIGLVILLAQWLALGYIWFLIGIILSLTRNPK